ncbi:MAG: hypothetical protein IJ542_03720 [Clostridia bacterium]|nr:hypothetical protein [Clostridia bacterium]
MNSIEYEKIKHLSYLEYCKYLQEKYGLAPCNYLRPSFTENPKASRTSEGLVAHHKFEDTAIDLSKKEIASQCPYEWQYPVNIVYCDYLEHLLLHVLICEYRIKDAIKGDIIPVGIAGIFDFIVPELNDWYSGFVPKQDYKICLYNKVIHDKNVYLTILKRFQHTCYLYPLYNHHHFYSSLGSMYGVWDKSKNKQIYFDIIGK